MKRVRHNGIILYLNNDWLEKGVDMYNPTSPKEELGYLKKWLEKVFANPQHCPTCGSLKYDVVIKYAGIEFHFGLWKIIDKRHEGKDKVIAETDYEKLALYAKRMSPERKSI